MSVAPVKQHGGLAYWILGLASVVYTAITLLEPITRTERTYTLSPWAVHSLELTIVLPLIAVWFIALWGSLRFRAYALSIQESADGRALKTLATGLVVLVSGLVLTSLLQSLNGRMAVWGHAKVWAIFSEYTAIVVALVALGLIVRGAWQLARLVQFRRLPLVQVVAVLVLAVIGIAYVLLLVHDPYRTATPNPALHSSYYLPDWLLLLSVVVPYLVVWYCGLLAVGCLRLYQAYSSGIIYRHALSRLSSGLLAVITASILIQILGAVSPSLVHLGLKDLLLVVYLLVIVYAVGHVVVAIGARSLAKIEEAGTK
jgi:hypothetical protein